MNSEEAFHYDMKEALSVLQVQYALSTTYVMIGLEKGS